MENKTYLSLLKFKETLKNNDTFKELLILEKEMEEPTFWDDSDSSSVKMKELKENGLDFKADISPECESWVLCTVRQC